MSTEASAIGSSSSADASTNRLRSATPASAASARQSSSSASEMSANTTSPASRSSAPKAIRPLPQPTSSSVSPGTSAALSRTRSRTTASCSSICASAGGSPTVRRVRIHSAQQSVDVTASTVAPGALGCAARSAVHRPDPALAPAGRARGEDVATAALAAAIVPDRVAAVRALPPTHPSRRDALRQVAPQPYKSEQRQPDPDDGEDERTELQGVDVVGDVVRAEVERQERRVAHEGNGDDEVPRASLPQLREQPVAERE